MLRKNKFSENFTNKNTNVPEHGSKAVNQSTNKVSSKKENSKNKIPLLIVLLVMGMTATSILIYSQLFSQNDSWYFDSDGDGFGDKRKRVSSKNQPKGYVADYSDSNDSDSCIPELNNCRNARKEIANFIRDYYITTDNQAIEAQLSFFEFPVTKYFNKMNLSKTALKNEFQNYYNRIIYHSHQITVKDKNIEFLNVDMNGDSLFYVKIELKYKYKINGDSLGLYVKNIENTMQLKSGLNSIKIIKVSGTNGPCESAGDTCLQFTGRPGRISLNCTCEKLNIKKEAPITNVDSSSNQNSFDCSSWNRNFGDACDDRNNNTINDRINENCQCVGTIRKEIKPEVDGLDQPLNKKKNYPYTGAFKYKAEFTTGVWDGFPLRQKPNYESKQIYSCPKDALIFVIYDSQEYAKVSIDGHIGYIAKNSIKRKD